jgi:hypothetical protein
LFLTVLVLQTWAAPVMPTGDHCIGVGPLPFDDLAFCGCTWGEVLFHGQPVPGAAITLTFGDGSVTGTTGLDALEPQPYFDLTAHNLGARRGDIVTLTAHFAGRTVTRTLRAWPESGGEQHVVLALPEQGVWSPWLTGGYTRALALDGDVAWAGGPAGVISISLSSGVSVVHTLPWADTPIRALAVSLSSPPLGGTEGGARVWAAGDGGIAEFDGSAWHTHTVPLAGTPRALAVDSTTGAVWVGGGDTQGSLAVYTGTWSTAGSFDAPVTALAISPPALRSSPPMGGKEGGEVWVGSWGRGVYRQDGDDWTHYRAVDGLASDDVLAATAGGGAVWFGTAPYLSGQGPRGGIARYDLTTETWRVYTIAHGLPADAALPQAPASVYALALGEGDIPWAGTTDDVHFLAGESWWTAGGLRPGPVMAFAPASGTIIAATASGLDRLDPAATPGAPPTAQIDAASPTTLTLGATLGLSGSGVDGDEGGGLIVAWAWASSLDGPLCTAASCELPHSLLASGIHSITLQVQDDEGLWSAPVETTVMVEKVWRVYLPLVLRQSPVLNSSKG